MENRSTPHASPNIFPTNHTDHLSLINKSFRHLELWINTNLVVWFGHSADWSQVNDFSWPALCLGCILTHSRHVADTSQLAAVNLEVKLQRGYTFHWEKKIHHVCCSWMGNHVQKHVSSQIWFDNLHKHGSIATTSTSLSRNCSIQRYLWYFCFSNMCPGPLKQELFAITAPSE